MIFPIWYFLILLLFSKKESEERPSDWFYAQRAYPHQTIPQEQYLSALQEIQTKSRATFRSNEQQWQFAGPTNIGGRITDIEASPLDPDLIYIGAASGGVFKSKNRGKSWTSIFDANPVLAIGDMALDPSNPQIIYVGTGESNGGGGSVAYDGNGIYKSIDGGNTWTYSGLEFSGSISKIIVNPSRPEIVYASAMGKLFSKNNQRGVFKSIDGGNSWEQVYFKSDSVGVIDMAMDPKHPDTIYVATWERSRNETGIDYGGPHGGVYRSFDGGKIWVKLTNGLPEGDDIGRIGLAIAPSETNKIFAFYVDESGDYLGLYKSINTGESFIKMAGKINVASFGWWFGKISIDPKNSSILYGMGLYAAKSIDGGNQFFPITDNYNEEVHVDQHALYIDPDNPQRLLLGNDGGLYESPNAGSSWQKINNLPITQFYTCHIDNTQPERLYGGAQDNNSIRTLSNEYEWKSINGGDGFVCLVDPTDNKYVYTESQYGVLVRSTDGGMTFFISLEGINSIDRRNWNTPIVFDPRNSSTLYYGTNRLYKSENRAGLWTPISPSLTPENNFRNFGTITSISVSSIDPAIIYCGTDVGLVWITINGGATWKQINQNLPKRYITSVAADPFNKNKVYVTISGYRYDEYLPHVFKSENNGDQWQDISRGLPPIPCNKLIVDPAFAGHLIVATDGGIWRTLNDGKSWQILGDGLPLVIVNDLSFHPSTRRLLAATYGRGMYTYNLDLPVSTKLPEFNISAVSIFPNPTKDFIIIKFEVPETGVYRFEVLNLAGKMISSKEYRLFKNHSSSQQIDLPTTSGIYLVSISSSQGIHRSVRIIKY
ncbi:MAG: T9SS type A sorting domain-containing protein [Saprospiraceae bacterium]